MHACLQDSEVLKSFISSNTLEGLSIAVVCLAIVHEIVVIEAVESFRKFIALTCRPGEVDWIRAVHLGSSNERIISESVQFLE